MRQNFNYHTHTYRCGHASMDSDESYVLSAIKAGYEILGMSDHAPYPHLSKPGDSMDYDQMQEYLDSMHYLKEKYANQINLKIGFEMEYFPDMEDYIQQLFDNNDYLLLGQHYPDSSASKDYCQEPNTDELVRRYGDLVCEGMRKFPYLYLAHPDYFCAGIYDFNEACIETSHRICQTAVETNTPLEVNIKLAKRRKKQYSDGIHYWYPFPAFWKIAEQYPVKCVYGFDAHNSELLQDMHMYDIADEILEGIKLDFIKEPLLK